MNKRNFGRVIKRIEKHEDLWDQARPPEYATGKGGLKHDCNTPYCFLGHAEYLRTYGKAIVAKHSPIQEHKPLAKWLGLTADELQMAFSACNEIIDFKRWHKAGKVS